MKITFANPDNFDSLVIDGEPFNALSQAYGALTIQKDREELDAAVLTFLGEHRQRMKLAQEACANEKEARIAMATDRNQCKQAAADAEANNERFQREFAEQMEALKTAHADAMAEKEDHIQTRASQFDDRIEALTEQLRIAKLPPAEQRAKELDAAMKAKEDELEAMKAEHASLIQ